MSNDNYNPFKEQQLRSNYSPFKDQQLSSNEVNSLKNRELNTTQNHSNMFDMDPHLDNNQPQSKVVRPWIERLKGVGIIVLFFIVQMFASLIFALLLVLDSSLESLSRIDQVAIMLQDMFAGMVISEGLVIIGLIIFYKQKLWVKFKQAFRPFLKFVFKMLGYYALMWIAMVLFSILDAALFPQYLTEAGSNQEVIETALLSPSVAMIISICLTAPIVEEFVFRYGVIKKLLYGVPKYLAAFIAALIFAFAHIGFSQMADLNLFAHLMLSYMGQALVFGIIYVREDNIFYPITLHIMNNVQAVILILTLANLA